MKRFLTLTLVACMLLACCAGAVAEGKYVWYFPAAHAYGDEVMGYAEEYAAERGLKVKLYPAEWARYGKAAGPKRNNQMAKDASAVIAFWDGRSKGTKNMIDTAIKLNKVVFVKMI